MGRIEHYAWSHTRSNTLAECPRRAFYEYYSRSEPEDRMVWKLKELITLPMWAGSVVDTVISQVLGEIRARGEMRTNLAESGVRMFRQGIVKSRDIVEQIRDRPRTVKERKAEVWRPLQQHYYEFDLGDSYFQALEKRIATCLANFELSEVLDRIKAVPGAQWGMVTKLDSDIAPSFILAKRYKVYAAYDFWFKDGDGLHILDWKSGTDRDKSQSSARRQLSVYALYGATNLKVPFDKIYTQAIWLQKAVEWKPEQADRNALKEVRNSILEEIERELGLVKIQRFPRKTVYLAKRENFPPRPTHRLCLNCKYRALCVEGSAACVHVGRNPSHAL